MDSGDIKQAHRLAHTLKSNAGQIGERQLQEVAAVVEDKLDKNEVFEDGMHFAYLKTELKTVMEKLTAHLAEESETKVEVASPEKAIEILDRLKPLLIGRKPECMYMLDDIRTIPGSEELAIDVENFDFLNAIAELKRLSEKIRG